METEGADFINRENCFIFFFFLSLHFIGKRERLASRVFGCLIKNFISSPEKRSGDPGTGRLGGKGRKRFDISAPQMLRIIKIVPTCVSLLEPTAIVNCCCGASCSNWPECKLSTGQPPQRNRHGCMCSYIPEPPLSLASPDSFII